MRDSRDMFSNLVQHNAHSWDSLPRVRDLSDEQMIVLMHLPQRIVEWDTNPLRSIFGSFKTGTLRGEAIEWVVVRMSEERVQYFYVNNEGCDHSKFAFSFNPRVV